MDAQAEAVSLDALAEILNLGLGHVIEELEEISGSRIDLHVPVINMMPRNEALQSRTNLNNNGKTIFVQQSFNGDISGEALLFFSEEESLKLLNGLLPQENHEALIEFSIIEEEMLLDLTNVAVSGVIYALSNLLSLHIDTELPCCEYGYFEDLNIESDLTNDMILFLTISFTVTQKNATAQLMFFQPRNTLPKLHQYINKRLGFYLSSTLHDE